MHFSDLMTVFSTKMWSVTISSSYSLAFSFPPVELLLMVLLLMLTVMLPFLPLPSLIALLLDLGFCLGVSSFMASTCPLVPILRDLLPLLLAFSSTTGSSVFFVVLLLLFLLVTSSLSLLKLVPALVLDSHKPAVSSISKLRSSTSNTLASVRFTALTLAFIASLVNPGERILV